MDRKQASEVLNEQILQRWPGWKPTEQEIRDWVFWLGRYSPDVIGRAALEHARTSRIFKRPITGDFFALCDRMQKELTHRRPTAAHPQAEATWFVMCTQPNPATQRPLPGTFYTVHPYPPDASPEACSETLLRQCTDLYGGLWRIYRDTTHSDMIRLRNNIRGE